MTAAPVAIVAQSGEWGCGPDGDSDDEEHAHFDRHAAETFVRRERRLTAGAEALEHAKLIGDADVEVVAQDREWRGLGDEDDEDKDQLDRHNTELFRKREKRLTAGAVALEALQMMGDADVEVVAQNREWAGIDDSDEEDGARQRDNHETELYRRREKRLTIGADALQKGALLGDADVSVVAQDKEWGAVADTDDEEAEDVGHKLFESALFQKRERRLSDASLSVKKGVLIGDMDVAVVAQTAEWRGIEDSDEEDDGAKQRDIHETAQFRRREKRLTFGAEVLQKADLLGDADVEVVAQDTEWCGFRDDDDDEDTENLDRHATEIFRNREKRLTAGASALQALQQGCIMGDADVEVMAQNKEWACIEDSDDEDEAQVKEHHATECFRRRERRLTVGADSVVKEGLAVHSELEVIAQNTEWSGIADEDDNNGSENLDSHATEVYRRREKRLTIGTEALRQERLLGDAEVQVVAQAQEWSGAGGLDSEDEAEEAHASTSFRRREKRLTVGAEALKEGRVLGDKDVQVVAQPKEWNALQDSDDEDEVQQPVEHETQVSRKREKRLTAGAEALKRAGLANDSMTSKEKSSWFGRFLFCCAR